MTLLATSDTHKHKKLWFIKKENTWINLRSRTEKLPSSHPDAIMWLASLTCESKPWVKHYAPLSYSTHKINRFFDLIYLFHEITFTSALWALIDIRGSFPVRTSHIDIVPSTEQEANTLASVGLHCKDIDVIVQTITFKERNMWIDIWHNIQTCL